MYLLYLVANEEWQPFTSVLQKICFEKSAISKSIFSANFVKFLKKVIFQNTSGQILLNEIYEMLCTIWYHLHNLENVKNIHGAVLLLVLKHSSMGVFCIF